MNKQKLLDLIKNPAGLTQSDTNALVEITEEYPYFQIGHALIAKFKSDHKALDAKSFLHIASITSPSRKNLKALIDGKYDSTPVFTSTAEEIEETTLEEAIEDVIETPEVESDAVETQEVKAEKIEEEPSIATEETKEIEEIKTETSQPDIETKEETKEETPIDQVNIKTAEAASDKLKFDIAEDEKPSEDDKDSIYKELEENLKSLQRRKSADIATTESPSAPKEEEEETPKPVAKRKPTTTKSTASSTTKRKSTATSRSTSSSAKTKTASGTKPSTRRSTGTRKPTSTTKTNAAASPTKRTATTKTTTTSKRPSTRKTSSTKSASTKVTSTKKTSTTRSTGSTKVTASSKKKLQKKVSSPTKTATSPKSTSRKKSGAKKNQSEIIENFIKTEPSISKPDTKSLASNAPQEDLSLDSVEIKEDLISENLAIIMEKQGKTQKAKDIYKKLIWKFPQKKAYFASRIEELDKS